MSNYKYIINLITLPTVAPETVKVRAVPEELKPGIEATLYCDAASSNPPATLSWWRDGIPVQGQLKLKCCFLLIYIRRYFSLNYYI